MARKLLSRQGGFVHDIGTLVSLSDEPNNIRLLSDRSLYILQNLSEREITFLSRYGEMIGGDFYLPVLAGSSEAGDVESAIDLIRKDLNNMAVEDLLECICEAIGTMAEQSESEGQAAEGTPSDGDVPIGPGEKFPTVQAYLDAKCNAANGIFDTIRGKVQWLQDNNVDLLAGIFGGVTSGLLVAIAISGPVGWAWALVGSVITGLASYLVRFAVNFSDLGDALDDTHDECVQSLFDAANTNLAEAAFIVAVEAGAPPITPVEVGLLNIMLSVELLNQLFDPRSDLISYESPDPYVCSGWSETFDFTIDDQGWENDATGGFPFGTYIPATGWHSVWAEAGSIFDERLSLRREWLTPPASITSIRNIYILAGTCGGGSGAVMATQGGTPDFSVGVAPLPCGLGEWDETAVGSALTPTHMISGMNGASPGEGQTDFILTSVVLTGTGVNPF